MPVNGAKYTKNIEESVEVYANPYDNCYDSPDIAQHYETVSDLCIQHTAIFLLLLHSQQVNNRSGEYMFLLQYVYPISVAIVYEMYVNMNTLGSEITVSRIR